jgi:hypothetical protein
MSARDGSNSGGSQSKDRSNSICHNVGTARNNSRLIIMLLLLLLTTIIIIRNSPDVGSSLRASGFAADAATKGDNHTHHDTVSKGLAHGSFRIFNCDLIIVLLRPTSQLPFHLVIYFSFSSVSPLLTFTAPLPSSSTSSCSHLPSPIISSTCSPLFVLSSILFLSHSLLSVLSSLISLLSSLISSSHLYSSHLYCSSGVRLFSPPE